jgi:phosphopantothenoylcysteine decarboxylase/phosphopantothenate--cysteine ligase
MGYAVAGAAAVRGARVTLVTGPVALDAPPGVEVVRVETADEMARATKAAIDEADALVMAAAVADWRPAEAAPHKAKKGDCLEQQLALVRTPDILAETKDRGPRVRVGFAAETWDVVAHAVDKLERKNLDIIVANDVSATSLGTGFGAETNAGWIVERGAEPAPVPLVSKEEFAHRILDRLAHHLRREGIL